MSFHFFRDMCGLFLLFSLVFLTIGCTKNNSAHMPVSFAVCREEELPDELSRMIGEKQEEPFQLTYENSAFLYLAVGYGRQPEGEYVAAVREIYENERGIFADMILVGLSHVGEREAGEPSVCPYIVLRCEKKKKEVYFL